ncbi:Re/Si-specific NAD(P)(+) transhydrogenase subunit alpha [Halotalea alkalilenta]|uniref:NAD(P) transhydrogenase subunit alpha part 1 n=1 Tax=Halotalea alkalilenta TaxID=376489 RepID=A0A172YFP4_9GAMM|nr:Re/Si-specific NAD(P)(+) transhydrogenase subunit alpha [Halotalea alkalilenta]ANF58091.1 NAD(P) transhydrogenase subunit alpha [Halotalea alkalilenta]
MKVAITRETQDEETRVAAVPDTVKRLRALNLEVVVERGAGSASMITDEEYEAAGATLAESAAQALQGAEVVLKVRRPSTEELALIEEGAIVLAVMDPYGQEQALDAMAKAGITAFAMELMPRITRAQSMDVLSSQANLAGYRAVVEAAQVFDRALPLMMTAAGTVPAAKVFVMGAGVAGLQAIATAKRLGASVSATDVRPAAKEQVASLGGKFIAVEDEEFKAAETAGGYAKEMSAEYQAKQAALVEEHISKQDIVITTALIPGRPAPKLITKAMLARMRPGSVVVDLAVERGGNVEGSVADQVSEVEGIKLIGYGNLAGRIATSASLLYSRNLLAFLTTLVDKEQGHLAIDFDDALVKATALTHQGRRIHPSFGGVAEEAESNKETRA